MFDKQNINKPFSIVSLIVLFLGVFISGVDFANFVSGYRLSLMFLLGLILMIVGVIFLIKNKVFVLNKKSIINLLVLLFTFSGGFFLIRSFIQYISWNLDNPLFAIPLMVRSLIGLSDWSTPIAELLFIGGLIYLIRANRKPEEKVLLEEELQQEEEENPVAQGKNQLSVGQWFWTIFLLGIPLINLILLLVWGFGAPTPRKNFSLACLLYMLIGIIIAILVAVIAAISGATNY